MSRCIESIKLHDGELPLLSLHEQRFQTTSRSLFGLKKRRSLRYHLKKIALPKQGLFKVRVVYCKKSVKVEIKEYKVSNHEKLALVNDDSLDYQFKRLDRTVLDKHMVNSKCDDFLIIKNGKVTDAWYSNIVFKKGDRWFTPNSYLLNGVKRQFLIRTNQIELANINQSDISSYDAIAFINALRDFEKVYSFTIKNKVLHLKPIQS